ncbi:MAG: hypothetical protein J6S85_08375 [Methanobrevibacter sp.]|nr:hypothetical protein [Methanobrevibacter sp.]
MLLNLMQNVVSKVSEDVGFNVRFMYGSTLSVVNEITLLRRRMEVYPAIILFQEGIVETDKRYWYEYDIPKMAIATTTKYDLTDMQRINTTFQNVIYPIFDSFQKQLRVIDLNYELLLNRTDIPFYHETQNTNNFNQLVDGCIIRRFVLKEEKNRC